MRPIICDKINNKKSKFHQSLIFKFVSQYFTQAPLGIKSIPVPAVRIQTLLEIEITCTYKNNMTGIMVMS